jgi:hypothetical protein
MKAKPKRKRHARFGDLYLIRDRVSGVAAWDYLDRYIKLKAKALQLERKGLKVRMVLPDFPHRPLLIIEK